MSIKAQSAYELRNSGGALVAYVRTVKTASGATAVQIVWSSRRGSRSIEHLGSAHDEAELAALKAAAAERLAAGEAVLDRGVAGPPGAKPLPTIVFSTMAVSHYVSHYIEHQTGWSIKTFVRSARRYRTVRIKAGQQILTAADPLPDDLRDALTKIRGEGVH